MSSWEVLPWCMFDQNAQEPKKGSHHAAGYDLTATAMEYDEQSKVVTYYTGVGLEIPNGCVGYLVPRSSVYQTHLIHADCVGIIDSDYRGEIIFRFYVPDKAELYSVGDRVGQIVIGPVFNNFLMLRVDKLTETERGDGGFGSTGK